MKKLAIVTSVAVAALCTFAGVFASASDLASAPAAITTPKVNKVDTVAATTPAQLLTVHCGARKGNLLFTENELETLLDLAEKYPVLHAKVCDRFTKRA